MQKSSTHAFNSMPPTTVPFCSKIAFSAASPFSNVINPQFWKICKWMLIVWSKVNNFDLSHLFYFHWNIYDFSKLWKGGFQEFFIYLVSVDVDSIT